MHDDGLAWRVSVGGEETSGILEHGCATTGAVFVCAHGAGGHMADRSVLQLSVMLRGQGVDVVRFNFLYRERGSHRPDPMARLKVCMEAVVARTRDELNPPMLIVGGRSMGGRVASMLVADGLVCDALLLFAYPLHPADKPEKLRDAHLGQLKIPILCFNGTRDALCQRHLMERVFKNTAAPWQMHWLEGADHSFRAAKSSGRTDDEVQAELAQASARWLNGLHELRRSARS